MKTKQLRAVKHQGNLSGLGLGPITVDPETGQVTFGAGFDTQTMLMIAGVAVAGYLVWTKVLGKKGLF